ncbi:MAG: YaeQ family protein [Candidatus Polarisedimenticolaceae bacterium]|nr:YaeQ family protein [Candidatus Polarisedimenticolaceae bacterium]
MAIKATIFKAELQITDLDRNHYHNYHLTLARHPSETDRRMMVRLLAFAMYADERLEFTKGLSAGEEPDLWQKSLSGEVELWIDLGQPDEKRIRQACHHADHVVIYTYSARSATVWWQQIEHKLTRFSNLTVINLSDEVVEELAQMAERTMRFQVTIQDAIIWVASDEQTVEVVPTAWR